MKHLPFLKRPFLARRILEIGGGHNPFAGVTHCVDKYPDDNTHRADDLLIQDKSEFKEGDLQDIPYPSEPKFDFLYLSHIFEHVDHPNEAVSEINRVARRGYLETPSPLREQIACPQPFDAENDIHILYCWSDQKKMRLHIIRKSNDRIGEFCECPNGRTARRLFEARRKEGLDLEPIIPGISKQTSLYFKTPIDFIEHKSFPAACQDGSCAYKSVKSVLFYSRFPWKLVSKRFENLKSILEAEKSSQRGTSTSQSPFV